MAPGLLDWLRSWVSPSDEVSYEVAEYVLSRREPDPANRLRVYDDAVTPTDVDMDDLPGGVYLLQEVKPSGMAGEVVWEEPLGDTDLEA